jgi:hypothetical protein
MEQTIFTQIRIEKTTRDSLRQLQGKYGCLTFNEVILLLIEKEIHNVQK